MRKPLDYAAFYEAWQREKENSELQRLDKIKRGMMGKTGARL